MFTEDKSVFFNTDEHAVVGLYNGATTVNGILEDVYADVFDGQVAVSSQNKAFRYDPADIASPATGTTFVAETVSYIVRDIQIDNGINRLILEKQ